jgi:hypothetical protein
VTTLRDNRDIRRRQRADELDARRADALRRAAEDEDLLRRIENGESGKEG